MKIKIIEVTNQFNWGKFFVARFDPEWCYVSPIGNMPLLCCTGWGPKDIIVFDLQTCEGAGFSPGGCAKADLEKHCIRVCPMFEPFLEWLYRQPLDDLDALPSVVNFTMEETREHTSLFGRRRRGSGLEDQPKRKRKRKVA